MLNALFKKTTAQTYYKSLLLLICLHTKNTHPQINEHMKNLNSQPATVNDSSLSSCCCCWFHWRCRCFPQDPPPPLPPRADRPSPPGSHRLVLSASSCEPWCSASFSSSSARQWQWPCGSSAWLRTPASAACSSYVGPGCGGRVWSHSPCGRADASGHSGEHGCPSLFGEAVLDSPDMDTR